MGLRRVAVLSSGRQDWGILRSTCVALRGAGELIVLAGGMACSARFGEIASEIEREGFHVECLPWPVGGEAPAAQEAAHALEQVSAALRRLAPDALVLVGDRGETAAAALAAVLEAVPVVHLHGGEETEGAVDNVLRHAITKLAHLHFVSHAEYARRVRQLGEPDDAVHVVGAPGLDNLRRDDLPGRGELEADLGISLAAPLVLVTVHPVTLDADPAAAARAVAQAMDAVPATYVVTLPNADTGGEAVRRLLETAGAGPGRVVVSALGERRYWGLLRVADAMLGNSSSALIEAPAVALPAVNVGDRQAGRLRGANVIDVGVDAPAIAAALRRALSPAFRAEVRQAPALFGDGTAGARIVEVLSRWTPPKPPRKRFVDRA